MEPVLFEGKTEGTIVPARGSTHFGWDAVFQPSGANLTSVTLSGPILVSLTTSSPCQVRGDEPKL